MDYEKAYIELFNAITDAISELCKSEVIGVEHEKGIQILKNAQIKTEEMYINEQ